MSFRNLLPKPLGGNESAAPGTSATRTALREFFPILLILVAVDISTDGVVLGQFVVLPSKPPHAVPAEIYVFAFLGAGAYAVTSLAFNPKQSIIETYRLTYRLIGALPLAAGVYLLSDLVVDASTVPVPVAGLAFLTGLYVRLTLRRLGDVADRLYGGRLESETELGQQRQVVERNVRHGWRLLTTGQSAEAGRQEVREWLKRADAILEAEDPTGQELARARDLSNKALGALEPGTRFSSDLSSMETGSGAGDTETRTTLPNENG